MTKLRPLLRVAGAAALLAAAAAFSWLNHSTPAPPEPVVVAAVKNLLGLPLFIAERKGYFDAEGLDVSFKWFPFGVPALESVLEGEAEVATVGETPLVFAALHGRPYAVIANYLSSDVHGVIARADRNIRKVADLRGKRVGVSTGTTAHYMLHVLLSDQGLVDADVELVPLPGPEQAAALAAGRVDAVASFAPYSAQSRRALGKAAVVFAPGLRYGGMSSLVTARDFSERRPEVALRLLRATSRALAWMAGHRQEVVDLAVREGGFDPAAVEGFWDELRPALSLDQAFIMLLEAEARWAVSAGLTPGTAMPNFLDGIDASALRRVHPEAVTVIDAS